MDTVRTVIENEILPRVVKPLRYVGTEFNAVKKDWNSVKLRTLFAFPDLYEVGMSHLGMRILYHLVNEQPDYLMERVFSPWTDMEQALRERDMPLFSLESYRPIADFDCLGITLQYEMSYTNILNMLDVGKIPLLAAERDDTYPLIIGGGPCAFNPEPLADFFDLFVLGEGEEVILEVFELIKNHRLQNQGKQIKEKLLKELVNIKGVYVPAFYEPVYNKNGRLSEIKLLEPAAPQRIVKRVVGNLDKAYFPVQPIVPYTEIVHDRIMLEVLRGCTRGCRFCQAGMLYRPVRERSSGLLAKQAEDLAAATGYNEISLTSLSTSDYSCIKPLLTMMLDKHEKDKIGISLPSLRVDAFSLDLAKEVQRVRKTGLTFAPEAGTQRLRDVINKGVTEENLIEVTTAAFEAGWTQIKLYFMIGLPTETFADLDGIADLAYKVLFNGVRILREKGQARQPKITVSVSSFVPKAHTPFQWERQDNLALLQEKQLYLKEKIRDRRINYNYHDAELSLLEAVFARGDRRLGRLLRRAWEKGCKFDGWTEHFHYSVWQKAFEELNMCPQELANLLADYESVLPWEHLDMGVNKQYLWQERQRAYETAITGDCRYNDCSLCGVCQDLEVNLVLQRKEGNADAGTHEIL